MKKQKPASSKSAAAKDVVQQPEQSAIWQDERFQTLFKDPRFRGLPQTVRKVKIDKRFQSMFSDEKFKVKYTVDKYGRRIDKSNAEDLRKFYDLDSNASDSDEDEQAKERLAEEKALARAAESDDAGDLQIPDNDALISDGEQISDALRERLSSSGVDYARGEGRLLTDSSSDDETSDEEGDLVANIDHVWGELDAHTEMTDDSTSRLAVCNMDWDRIRATDLMVLCSSFLPAGGSISSVKIYASAYGKERLALEEAQGPAELVGFAKPDNKKQAKKVASDSEEEEDLVQAQDSEAEEGDEYHMEKLRQYQLNRLKYYYAVVECDSVETADKIYKECDGTEYESSATRVDLRFIPDDTNFDDDEPTDVCTQLPDANSYKPRQFTTTALQQIKVDLTWDETAVERKELSDKLASGKLNEVNDKDLRNLVAYSSEEDNNADEEEAAEETCNKSAPKAEENHAVRKESKKDVINKYKALLAEINEKEQEQKKQKYEMEFTWEVNDAKEEKNDQEASEEEAAVAKDENKHLTPIEKVLKKRSEKNKKRKTERKRKALLAKGIDPDESANDSDESDDLPDGIDLNDPYFAEEFANNDFIKKPNKKKESKKNKREQLEEQEKQQQKEAQELALLLEDEDDEKQHFSLEKIMKAEQETKSKRKRRKLLKKSKSAIAEQRQEVADNFEVNVADDRFKNIYTSHLYNIDPTDSHFKKTKGMEKLIQEKLKRRQKDDDNKVKTSAQIETSTEAKRPKKQIENNLLVKSLKRKLQQQQMRQK